jgi:hypothetical protein
MSAKFVKDLAIIAMTPTADHSAKKGFLVVNSSGSAALNASATVAALGVILDGETTTGKDSIGLLGGNLGTVKLKAGGNITLFAKLQQKNDGTVVVDAGSGARVLVGLALEAAATDEIFEAMVFYPIIGS